MTNTSSTAATTTMRACALDEFNAPGSVRDVPIPLAGEGEVLVRVRAAGVNPFDAAVMAGLTQTMMEHRFPLVPGVDAAGVVEAVGPGETEFAVGDEVFGQFLKPVAGEGTYADYVVVTAGGMIAHKPAAIDFAQAAALGTPALAALESVNALAPQEMQAALAAKVFALPDVEDRPTTLSAPGARAIWLKDSVPASPNDAFLGHREIGHFHPWDGSLHIVLPPAGQRCIRWRGRERCRRTG